jgi:hypothetical protein
MAIGIVIGVLSLLLIELAFIRFTEPTTLAALGAGADVYFCASP